MRNGVQDNNLITVEQARKILGAKADSLTDEQITSVLNMLRLMCSKQIESALEKNHPKLDIKHE